MNYSNHIKTVPKLERDWEVALECDYFANRHWEIDYLQFKMLIQDTVIIFHAFWENNIISSLSDEMKELENYWYRWSSPELSSENLSEAKRQGLKTLYILRKMNVGLAAQLKQERYKEISQYIHNEAQTLKEIEHTVSDLISTDQPKSENYTEAINFLSEMVGTIHVISKVFSAQEIFENVIHEKFSLKEIEYSILDCIESYQPTPENYLEIIIFLKELRQKLYQITESLFIKARELMPQSNLTGKYEWRGTCRPLYIECTRCGIHELGEEVIGGICRVCWSDPD